jgi:hypothetical protein
MKTSFAVTAAFAATLFTAPALAANDITLDVNGGYSSSTGSVNQYDFGGSALWSINNPGFNAQLNINETHTSVSPFNFDLIQFSGDAFWRDRKGTLGMSVAQHSFQKGSASGLFTFLGNISLTSFGGFGEWFIAPELTLKFQGGGFTGDADGLYLGTEGTWYVFPDLSVSTGFDYVRVSGGGGNQSRFNVGTEYLLSQNWPLSLGLDYSYTKVGGGNGNTFGLSLRYRFGGTGSLNARDRRNVISWNGALPI